MHAIDLWIFFPGFDFNRITVPVVLYEPGKSIVTMSNLRASDPLDSSRALLTKHARFETLESRLVMSAQALTDLPDLTAQSLPVETQITQQIETSAISLDQAHQQTGVDQVYQNYGFAGNGQTVVVIDSGIAWDHYALGGGYGAGYRVVGGWDFAENDANPFDDGGAGYHGTHVSGIIGSSDAENRGVASEVDLVGLRVFDDNGNGSLQWVEQALQWVHQHRDSFQNPITTVNLSIGTNWNSNNLPTWATLEDEFAQLEADGIFISVAAGNSFQQFKNIGVSYPAVSEHVVPVASHGANGTLSDFSQRNENVLVAPGENILSTVPGHLLGQAVSSRFLGASGTSMAAPYVAGSSVLVRQAMEFMGYENVDQAAIYQKLQQTADRIYDAVTGQHYNKINLSRAINSIIPDDYSDRAQSATEIGVLQGGEKLTGTIGTFGDQDVIRFQAGRTGQLTLNFSQTHDLDLVIQTLGSNATINGKTLTMQVVAGQSYTLQLSTSHGIGHYSIDSAIALQNVSASNLGTVFSSTANVVAEQNSWYEVTAGRGGVFAFQLTPASGSGSLSSFQVYDAQQNLLGTASVHEGVMRLNVNVTAGQSLMLKLSGSGSGSLAMQNLVSLSGGNLIVNGNNQANSIVVQDGTQIKITVDGFEYSFARAQVNRLMIYGHQGQDTLEIAQSQSGQQVHLKVGEIYAFGGAYQTVGNGLEAITYRGQLQDRVSFFGSAGDDWLTIAVGASEISGDGFVNRALGVKHIDAVGGGGFDRLVIEGTSDRDVVFSGEHRTTLVSSSLNATTTGFDQVDVRSNGGNDQLVAVGSSGDENLQVTAGVSRLDSSTMSRRFSGFAQQQFFGGGGNDSAQLTGSVGSKNYMYAYSDRTIFENQNQSTFAKGFGRTTAMGGTADFAILFDSAGNDHFEGDLGWAQMSGEGYQNQAIGFGTIIGRSSGGQDTSRLNTAASGSNLYSDATRATLSAGSFQVRSVGFASLSLASTGLTGPGITGTGSIGTGSIGTGSASTGSALQTVALRQAATLNSYAIPTSMFADPTLQVSVSHRDALVPPQQAMTGGSVDRADAKEVAPSATNDSVFEFWGSREADLDLRETETFALNLGSNGDQENAIVDHYFSV